MSERPYERLSARVPVIMGEEFRENHPQAYCVGMVLFGWDISSRWQGVGVAYWNAPAWDLLTVDLIDHRHSYLDMFSDPFLPPISLV